MTVDPSTDARANVDADSRREEGKSLLPPVDTLFVWDFDWTIVNCNSDEYVPAAFLGDEETERRLREMIGVRGPTRWHECVSDLVNDCVEERGLSMDDVLTAAASMPYLMDVCGTLEDVDGDASCGQAIISDGNDSFIGAFLRKNGLERCFTHGVETNMGRWESHSVDDDAIRGGGTDDTTTRGGHRFSVVHQSSKYGGHTNARCPPNLCKTQVLLDVLGRTAETTTTGGGRPRVVYVGDGPNDACPALCVLGERDVLLARDGRRICHPNSKSGGQPDDDDANAHTGDEFGILSTIEGRKKKEALAPRCRVHTWNSGKQLRFLVSNILNEEVTT